MSRLDDLPSELLLAIADHLRIHDRTKIIRVSRHFHVLEDLLWRNIDLHASSFHSDTNRVGLRIEAATNRSARSWMMAFHDEADTQITTLKFLARCLELKLTRPARWQVLRSKVQTLCLDVTTVEDAWLPWLPSDTPLTGLHIWNTLLDLPALESLEIIGQDNNAQIYSNDISSNIIQWASLKRLRLRGYFPSKFVDILCTHAPNLQKLDLGIIDQASVLIPQSPNTAINTNTSKLQTTPSQDRYSILNQQYQAPLPLLLPSIPHFPQLTHLHLCKPNQGHPEPNHGINHDLQRDEDALTQWMQLLSSTHKTLIDLTFDLRICTSDDSNLLSFLRQPSLHPDRPGDERFLRFILPMLCSHEWPALKYLTFRGVSMPPTAFERAGLPEPRVLEGEYLFFGLEKEGKVLQGTEDGLVPNEPPLGGEDDVSVGESDDDGEDY